jgi:hypothetical protein
LNTKQIVNGIFFVIDVYFKPSNALSHKYTAMIPIHAPNREEIKDFLKKIENRIRRNASKIKPSQKFEPRL